MCLFLIDDRLFCGNFQEIRFSEYLGISVSRKILGLVSHEILAILFLGKFRQSVSRGISGNAFPGILCFPENAANLFPGNFAIIINIHIYDRKIPEIYFRTLMREISKTNKLEKLLKAIDILLLD